MQRSCRIRQGAHDHRYGVEQAIATIVVFMECSVPIVLWPSPDRVVVGFTKGNSIRTARDELDSAPAEDFVDSLGVELV